MGNGGNICRQQDATNTSRDVPTSYVRLVLEGGLQINDEPYGLVADDDVLGKVIGAANIGAKPHAIWAAQPPIREVRIGATSRQAVEWKADSTDNVPMPATTVSTVVVEVPATVLAEDKPIVGLVESYETHVNKKLEEQILTARGLRHSKRVRAIRSVVTAFVVGPLAGASTAVMGARSAVEQAASTIGEQVGTGFFGALGGAALGGTAVMVMGWNKERTKRLDAKSADRYTRNPRHRGHKQIINARGSNKMISVLPIIPVLYADRDDR